MDNLQTLLYQLQHAHWSCPVVGLLFVLESAPLIGLFIPGVLLAAALGALASQGNPELGGLVACAALGGLLGDLIGYSLGRLGRDEWLRGREGSRRRSRYRRAERLLTRFGPWAILLGRFLWVVHPAVGVIAGAGGVSLKRYLAVDLLAVSLWSLAYFGIGYLGAGVWLAEELQLMKSLGVLVLIVLLVLVPVLLGSERRR